MPILSVLGQKGGVGKTALARLIAVETIKAGWPSAICDLDPAQGTATTWKIRRDHVERMPDVPVDKCRNVQAAMRRVKDFSCLVLDGPGFADRTTADMARVSDLVVIPTGPGLDDMRPQIELAYELQSLRPAPRILMVFSRARGSKAELDRAREFMRSTGLHLAGRVLPEAPSIRLAHNDGLCASEVPSRSVGLNAHALATEIRLCCPAFDERTLHNA